MRKIIMIQILLATLFAAQQSNAQTVKTKYRLVVSFGSVCCGIDRDAWEEINKFIGTYQIEKKVKLQYKRIGWGEEGEMDYAFNLTEISKKERTSFISKIKAIAERGKTVSVLENSTAHEEYPRQRIYRLIISFGSECCGIDRKTEEEISKIVSAYEKKNQMEFERNKVYWGKEGEFDYCYMLAEIAEEEQAKLITEIKKIAEKSKLVEIKERELCRIGNR